MSIILWILVGLFLLFLLLALIAPKSFNVERSILINKPVDDVFKFLLPLSNQDLWSPWTKKDPNMKKEMRGVDGTVGAVSAWEGNKDVGSGEQEITGIIENERIDAQLRFFKPWKSVSDAYLITEKSGQNETKVRWGFSGKTPIPFNIMMMFMNMDKTVGKDFDEGLESLKSVLESD